MKLKRIMAMVLCLSMVLSTMSFNVFAETPAETVLAQTKDINGNVIGEYADFECALAVACADDSDVARIEILGDITQTEVISAEYYDITNELVIGSADGENYTVSINPVADSVAVRVMDGGSLTIEENITIDHLDVVANGFATTGENMNIDGTLKAISLKQWTSNGTITISETGKVWLGFGDGQFDLAYGNGTVTVNGNGDTSEPQFKAGYSGTRGNGNILNLNNTYFEGGAWFTVNGFNGTFNVDKSILKVSGGDGAGSLTVASTGNTIKLTNGSTLDVANLTLGANNEITIDGTSQVKVTKLTGNGTIRIDAATLTAESTPIVGDASEFTGSIELINNDELKAEIDDNGNIVLVEAPAPAGPVLSGSGTEVDPYVINDLDDLKSFRDDVNAGNTYEGKYVLLTDDINLTGEAWTPIGTSIYDKTPTNAKMFAGNFDGGNHTITGLTSEGYVPNAEDIGGGEYSFGLFGYVYGANISNVKLAEVNIDGTTRKDSEGNDVDGSGVAALIGYYVPADGKTVVIENCHVLSGTVKASNNMGGLIGYMHSQLLMPEVDITVKDCSNAADVTTEAREAGGILGYLGGSRTDIEHLSIRGTITFENCVNTGDITSLGTTGNSSAGGIVGCDRNEDSWQHAMLIYDGCENSGAITVYASGETHAGGIGACYYSIQGTRTLIKNCTNTGDVVVLNPSGDIFVGGLISHGGIVEIIDSTNTGSVTVGEDEGNKYIGAATILFLNKMNDFSDTIGGTTYFLNGGVAPALSDMHDGNGNYNFYPVKSASKDGFDFGGWYNDADFTGDLYSETTNIRGTGNLKLYAKWTGPVAKIGKDEFDSIQAAVDAAQPNDTITLLDDVTEDVTIKKSITIDGVNKEYTGNINISGNVDVTIQNVKFVKGYINHTSSSTSGNLIVKGCSFADGGYAVTTARINSVTIEDCTVTNQSLLYAKLSTPNITVKNVNVSGGNYVAHIVYGNTAYFENVTAKDMTGYGIQTQNHGAKTITLKNCSFDTPRYVSLAVWTKGTASDTFVFEGENTMSSMSSSEYAKYVLADADATLKASEGHNVTTENEKHSVVYEDGAYKVQKVAKVGEKHYYSLQEAVDAANDGDIITVVADIKNTQNVTINNKNVVIDLDEHTLNGAILPSTGDITVKNGTIINKNYAISAIEVNEGTLVVENVNIDSERHAIRIDGIDGDVDATINGGIYKVLVNNGVSAHTINVSGSAVVTIKDGTFYGPKGTPNGSAMGGSALQSRGAAVVTVEGGNFSGGVNNTITGAAVSNISVTGGTFDQDPSAYVAEGARAVYDNMTRLWNVIAGEHSIDVEATLATVKGEEEVAVTVKVNGPDFANAEWTLSYDKNVFTYDGYEDGTSGTDTSAPSVAEGVITDKLYTYAYGNAFKGDTVVVTYKFKSISQPTDDVKGTFTLSDASVDTVLSANFGTTPVLGDSAEVTVKLRDFGELSFWDETNGVKNEITSDVVNDKYELSYDGFAHAFTVDTSVDDEKITYDVTKDGVAVSEIKACGTYKISYIIEKLGYEKIEKTLTVVVGQPEFELETSYYTLGNHTLVMVYTDAAGMTPTFDGKAMFDISESGYEYQETPTSEGDPYEFVYGIVIPELADGTTIADLREKVSFNTNSVVKIGEYDADVNFVEGVNDRDAVVVINTYGGYSEQMVYNLLSRVLKADVDKNKVVNLTDVTEIEKTIAGTR